MAVDVFQSDNITSQHYQQIIEAAGDVIYLTDEDGYFTYVNSRVHKLLGYHPHEVIGQHFTKMVAPDWRDRVLAFYVKQLNEQTSETMLEFPALTKSCDIIWVEQTVRCIVENGAISRFQAIVRDINKRKLTENELSQHIEQLTALQRVDIELMEALDIDYILSLALDQTVRLSQADTGFIGLIQPDSHVQMAQMIGDYPASSALIYEHHQTGIVGDVIRRRHARFVPDISAVGYHSVIPHTRAQMAVPLLSRNGLIGVLCLECRRTGLFTQSMLEFIQLITTRVSAAIENGQLYIALQQQLQDVHELYTLKSRFVSMVSHEFRTPLAVILSASNNLHDYFERMTVEQRAKHIRKIGIQVQNMTSMLDDVLTIGHMESGAIQFMPVWLDLHVFCQQIIDEFRVVHESRDIRFTCAGDCNAVYLDEKLMRQIISNLLSNALKYSSAHQPVAVALHLKPEQITLIFRDQGIGIPETDYQQLFEAFHRATNVGTVAGTGLGLAITKFATELHGGQITFTSKMGAGTTFIVTIPQEKVKVDGDQNTCD